MKSTWKGQERQRQKIQHMLKKRDKLEMLRALIYTHERAVSPDVEEIKNLKRRANELAAQLTVASTQITNPLS